MKVTGLFRIKAIAPCTTNLVLVTDGDSNFEVTEQDYLRAGYSPPLAELGWKS